MSYFLADIAQECMITHIRRLDIAMQDIVAVEVHGGF